MLTYVISTIALAISFLALIVSIFSHINSVKQTRIMQERLNEQTKHKFTDDPINAYTEKLDRIGSSIDRVAIAIKKNNTQQ